MYGRYRHSYFCYVKREVPYSINLEVKVKVPEALIDDALRHEDVRKSGGTAPPSLTSAVDGGECSASRPCRFTPGETAPSTQCIGGWVGPRGSLDDVEIKKALAPAGNRISIPPVNQPVA
jgi:hypothetical protein